MNILGLYAVSVELEKNRVYIFHFHKPEVHHTKCLQSPLPHHEKLKQKQEKNYMSPETNPSYHETSNLPFFYEGYRMNYILQRAPVHYFFRINFVYMYLNFA